MIEKLHQYKEELEKASAKTPEEIELLRVRFLGQKGVLKELFGVFKTVPNEHKKEFGKQLNELKNLAQEKINQLKTSTSTIEDAHGAAEDLTLPGNFKELGVTTPYFIGSPRNHRYFCWNWLFNFRRPRSRRRLAQLYSA